MALCPSNIEEAECRLSRTCFRCARSAPEASLYYRGRWSICGWPLPLFTVLGIVLNRQLVTERIEKAHAAVDIVYNLADGYYKAYKAGQMTEEEAKKRFLEANNYVWYEDHSNYALYLRLRDRAVRFQSRHSAIRRQGHASEQGRQRHAVRGRADGHREEGPGLVALFLPPQRQRSHPARQGRLHPRFRAVEPDDPARPNTCPRSTIRSGRWRRRRRWLLPCRRRSRS